MNEKLIIPASIVIAGAFIGLGLYLSGGGQQDIINDSPAQVEIQAKKVDPASDHIKGNPAAEIFVIEYSDLECPFCKRYHDDSLNRLITEYAEDSRVSFVFRHFPLDEPYTRALHETANEEAIASECVAKLGGNDAFFTFINDIFATTASDGKYDLNKLPDMAVAAGVDKTAFSTCYKNQDTADIVAAHFQDGVQAGVQGTPSVFIQTKKGKTFESVPDYNAIKIAIDAYLSQLK